MKTWLKNTSTIEKLLSCCLIISHVFIFLFVLKDAPYFGDEQYYSESSNTLLNIFYQSDNPLGRSLLMKRLVGNGYFMPFYSSLLTPLKYFNLSSLSTRLIFMLVNLFLSFILVVQFRIYFGKVFSIIFLTILALLPTVLLFDASITPEALVAKFILFAILLFYRRSISNVDWSRLLCFSILMVAIVLFRQSTILLFPAFCLWYIMQEGNLSHILNSIKKLTTILLPSTVVITIAILLWSSQLTKKFGPGYLTTTSTDLSFMVLWGDGTEDLGNQDYPSVWKRLYKHYLQKSRDQGITFKEAVSADKKVVWQNLTLQKYLSGVKRNVIAFVAPANDKIKYMFEKADKLDKTGWIAALQSLNAVICFIIILAIIAFLIFPKIIAIEHRKLLSLLLFVVPFLMIHIFVARANGRHGMIIWWLLAVIGSVIFANTARYIKRRKIAIANQTTMISSYAIVVNFLRIFIGFILLILLFF